LLEEGEGQFLVTILAVKFHYLVVEFGLLLVASCGCSDLFAGGVSVNLVHREHKDGVFLTPGGNSDLDIGALNYQAQFTSVRVVNSFILFSRGLYFSFLLVLFLGNGLSIGFGDLFFFSSFFSGEEISSLFGSFFSGESSGSLLSNSFFFGDTRGLCFISESFILGFISESLLLGDTRGLHGLISESLLLSNTCGLGLIGNSLLFGNTSSLGFIGNTRGLFGNSLLFGNASVFRFSSESLCLDACNLCCLLFLDTGSLGSSFSVDRFLALSLHFLDLSFSYGLFGLGLLHWLNLSCFNNLGLYDSHRHFVNNRHSSFSERILFWFFSLLLFRTDFDHMMVFFMVFLFTIITLVDYIVN